MTIGDCAHVLGDCHIGDSIAVNGECSYGRAFFSFNSGRGGEGRGRTYWEKEKMRMESASHQRSACGHPPRLKLEYGPSALSTNAKCSDGGPPPLISGVAQVVPTSAITTPRKEDSSNRLRSAYRHLPHCHRVRPFRARWLLQDRCRARDAQENQPR